MSRVADHQCRCTRKTRRCVVHAEGGHQPNKYHQGSECQCYSCHGEIWCCQIERHRGRQYGRFCRPIVDQLYVYNVPTLKSTSVCLNSLRVVSPGVQGRKSTRKDPVTRTESLVRTRPPPRTVADSVSIQWSSEV